MLIGIVAGVLIVGALSYATGVTKLIRSSVAPLNTKARNLLLLRSWQRVSG
jgi:hypothetical protein